MIDDKDDRDDKSDDLNCVSHWETTTTRGCALIKSAWGEKFSLSSRKSMLLNLVEGKYPRKARTVGCSSADADADEKTQRRRHFLLSKIESCGEISSKLQNKFSI